MPYLRNIVVIGGGLAGLGAAYWAARQGSRRRVVVLERADRLVDWIQTAAPLPLGRVGMVVTEEDYPAGWPDLERILEKWPAQANRDWLASLEAGLAGAEDGSFSVPDGNRFRRHLQDRLQDLGVEIRTGFAVEALSRQPDGGFRVWSRGGEVEEGGQLLLATGGERNHGLKLARELGLEVRPPLAAYVRLRLASPKLGSRLGPLTREVRLRCLKSGQQSAGEITLSPRGLEGPAVSSLSARQHVFWHQLKHRLQIEVDWFPELRGASIRQELATRSERGGRRVVGDEPLFGLQPRQWEYFLQAVRIDPGLPWPRLKAKKIQALTQRLKCDPISVEGMGLPAGERAWAGGISLSSLDVNSGQALQVPGLYCAGEILDFLGMPNGAHLNAAWASAYLAGSSMGLSVD